MGTQRRRFGVSVQELYLLASSDQEPDFLVYMLICPADILEGS